MSWVPRQVCCHQGSWATVLGLQFPHEKIKGVGSALRFPSLWSATDLKHQIAWHILSCAPVSDRCNLQDFAAAGQRQKSKPESWFIARAGSLRMHAAEAGPRVLLWWQPVFLPWNVFFEEKQDHWKRQAGICTQPSASDLPSLPTASLRHSWRSVPRGPGEPGHRPGKELVQRHIQDELCENCPQHPFFSFSLTLLAFIKSMSPFPFLYFNLTHSRWRMFSEPTQNW